MIGLSALATASFTDPVFSSRPYHHLRTDGRAPSNPTAASLSHARFFECPAPIERGEVRPCGSSQPWSTVHGAREHMSHTPVGSAPSSPEKIHGPAGYRHVGTTATTTTFEGKSTAESGHQIPSVLLRDRDTQSPRARPVSWHPSTPVEPPLESTQFRPIGVHAILNPPGLSTADAGVKRRSSRDLHDPVKTSSPPCPSLPAFSLAPTVITQPPSTKGASLSPGARPRRIITPVSPSARFTGAGGKMGPMPGKISVSESPFVHEQLGGLYHAAPAPGPGSPLSGEPGILPPVSYAGHVSLPPVMPQPQLNASFFGGARRSSVGPSTNPSSQASSPATPYATLMHPGRISPALSSVGGPHHGGPTSVNSSPRFATEPLSRLPSLTGSSSATFYGSGPGPDPPVIATNTTTTTSNTTTSAETPPFPGMIPCFIDLKSGSSSQAEKRKANSDASRRFRNRKKNEVQMEKRVAEQEEEIAKHMERIQRQVEEIRALMAERDYYRSERDFFRERLGQYVSPSQAPLRPPSPRPRNAGSGAGGGDAMRSAVPASASGRRPPGDQQLQQQPPLVLSASAPPAPSMRAPEPWAKSSPNNRALSPVKPDQPTAGQDRGTLPAAGGSWTRA